MTTNTAPAATTVLSPDEAFAVLGDEARLEILQALAEADRPVAYSDLFERIDYDDISNFSYHLEKLVGHFVSKSDEGYNLRRPGELVVEAVLSGAVTTDPVRKWTETDNPCPFCSTPIEIGYQQERVTLHCPECSGLLGDSGLDDSGFSDRGNLGYRPLPPAGVQGRTVGEVFHVSEIWTGSAVQAVARGVCPRCSGTIGHSVSVCESHDTGDGPCDQCGYRFGASATATCNNCIFEITLSIASHVGAHPQSMGFVIDHGIDPVAPEGVLPFGAIDETILSHDPFEAQYTITLDDETLTITVDNDLSVVDTTRETVSGSGPSKTK